MGNKQGILNYSDEIKIFSIVCDIKFLEYFVMFLLMDDYCQVYLYLLSFYEYFCVIVYC